MNGKVFADISKDHHV